MVRDATWQTTAKWWFKILAQNFLGMLPFGVGRKLQQRIVSAVNGPLAQRDYTSDYRLERSIRNVRLLQKYAEFTPLGARVIEIGTGWRGCDALLFHVLGASKIVTTDHEPWLTREGLVLSIGQLNDSAEAIAELVPLGDRQAVYNRLEGLKNLLKTSTGVDDLLAAVNITYLILRDGDARVLGEDVIRADLFYSESVLQRVPRPTIGPLMQHYANNLCDVGAAWFHRTDQRDIHALSHARTGVWALRYLYVPRWLFETVISGRFTSQNRLRESDFEALLGECGVDVRYVESRRLPEDVSRIEATRDLLSAEFREKSAEDIATRASIYVGVMSSDRGRSAVRKVVEGDPQLLEA